MPSNLSQKSSFRLFLWGLLLIPFAFLADAILDAVLFGEGSIQEQLFSPSSHELAIRTLFCVFILAAIYLGMHYLSKTAQKEGSLHQSYNDLGLVRQDLEEFHDNLFQQLRSTSAELETTIELLKAQCDEGLDEKTCYFIKSTCDNSNKLSEQLETIMVLTEEMPFGEPRREQVKLDKLALEVIDEIEKKQPVRQVDFKIQPWINGWCDQKMLRLVIYNLFCNAMDFIPLSQQGCVEFGMFNRSTQKVFFVRDNGTGFSDAQAKRFFDAFPDSSLDSDLPRDSIKRAIARRVINRHGGQIWAEGIQGTGGTIYFTCDSV